MNANYYVLHVDPQAQYDWERCYFAHPLTGEACDLNTAIAAVVGNRPGQYLLSVRWEIDVLERCPTEVTTTRPAPVSQLPQLPARLAS